MQVSTKLPTTKHHKPSEPGRMHHRLGGWLPKDHNVLERWLDRKISHVNHPSRINEPLHPVVEGFKEFIEGDPVFYMGFHQMFEQIPNKPPYNENTKGEPQVRDYMTMLRLFNHTITTAPQFEEDHLIGVPINVILVWPMGTPAGLSMFCNPKVNDRFKKMFDVWSVYLKSSDSRNVLTSDDGGWFGPKASAAIPNFAETFICDPSKPYWGFTCWDDFFTRTFRDGVRPVESPDNDNIVNNACESTIYHIRHNVKANDQFWIKGDSEPYNLRYMLNNSKFAGRFFGGTVYQAFLSALSYHRWHSPVNGKIVDTEMVPGTYYAESPTMGFQYGEDRDGKPDPYGPENSQAFITSIATRAMIYIEADNPNIGLMCFIAVGMVEISTCEITVKKDHVVKKGDELGMFHFGGSTHCLVFRPETQITFPDDLPTDKNIPLNSAIATVK